MAQIFKSGLAECVCVGVWSVICCVIRFSVFGIDVFGFLQLDFDGRNLPPRLPDFRQYRRRKVFEFGCHRCIAS